MKLSLNRLSWTMLMILATVSLLVSCSKLSQPVDSNGDLDWHLYRGNSGLSAYSETSLPKHPELLWTNKSGVRTVSSPVIDQGTSYWCDVRGRIHGVNLQGLEVFTYDLNTSVEATPLIHNSVLYIGRIDGFLSAISLAKKDTVWNFETEGQISASPNISTFEDQTALVVGSYDNYMYCINASTGKLIKRFVSGYYLNGAAALWKNHVVFGGCDAWVRIIDTETGKTTDSLETEAYIPCSPAILENKCYIGDYSGNIFELTLDKGRIAGHKKLQTANSNNGEFLSVPALNDVSIFFFSGKRNLVSMNRNTGEINWKFMLKGNAGESAPLICEDKIIACTKTGIISILDAASGNLIWEYDTGEPIVASPAVIHEHFLILSSKGTLFCFGEK